MHLDKSAALGQYCRHIHKPARAECKSEDILGICCVLTRIPGSFPVADWLPHKCAPVRGSHSHNKDSSQGLLIVVLGATPVFLRDAELRLGNIQHKSFRAAPQFAGRNARLPVWFCLLFKGFPPGRSAPEHNPAQSPANFHRPFRRPRNYSRMASTRPNRSCAAGLCGFNPAASSKALCAWFRSPCSRYELPAIMCASPTQKLVAITWLA